MNPNAVPIKSTTQHFLSVEDIDNDILILKDGSCALVIETTATNFGLLSEKEQDAAIYSYGALLNSLSFTIQILIRSKRKDVTSYLKLLEAQEAKITRPEIKAQISKYREFITHTVQLNNVLEKKFYIILPMSALELGVAKTMMTGLRRKQAGLPYPKEYILEKAHTNLHPKRDHVFRLLNRLGLKPHQLSNQELIRLLFSVYNRDSQGQALASSEEYQTVMVKPAARFQESVSLASKEEKQEEPQTADQKTTPPPTPTPVETQKAAAPQLEPSSVSEPSVSEESTFGQKSEPVKITPPREEANPKVDENLIKPDKKIQSKINQLVNESTTKPVQNNPTESKPIFEAEKGVKK